MADTDDSKADVRSQTLSDTYQLRLLMFLGLLGLIVCFFVQKQVFPAASIDIKLSRPQILKLSEQWAYDLGYREQKTIKSVVFTYDDQAKTFLEFELGLAQANELMKHEIPVWSWSTRLCKEFQLESFRIYLSPDGQLKYFNHALENDRALPSLAHDDAESLAHIFIEKKAGISLSGWKLIHDESISQLHRTDYSFIWEDGSRQWKGAKLRVSAYVSGNSITSFYHYLYIPETWQRKFSTIRSYNLLLRNIASAFSGLLGIASAFVFFWALVSHQIRWRFTLISAAGMALLYLLAYLNNINLTIDYYSPQGAFLAYLSRSYIGALSGAFGSFISAAFLFGSAEVVYRLFFHGQVAMENLFKLRALRSPQVLFALIVGHAVFGISLAWQMFYYLSGKHLGFWCPLEISNYQVLSAVVPAFASICIGILAATNEEFLYRVIGLGLLQKFVGRFWIANLMQASVWAFMHSNYPQEPAYARGLELTVAGLFYGWIIRRYGVLACLVAHYLFDAFWGVMPLLSSPVAMLKLSAVVAVMPFLFVVVFAFWLIRKYGIFKDRDLLANASVKNVVIDDSNRHAASETVHFDYKPLSFRTRVVLGILIVSLIPLQFLYNYRAVADQGAHLNISRQSAISLACKYLLAKHYDLSNKLVSAYASTGIGNLQYVFEKVGFKKTNELALTVWQPFVWQIRFFHPLNPEEYSVEIDGGGRVVSCYLKKAEDSAGANLAEGKARELAEKFVLDLCPEFAPLKFDSVAEHKRANRTDYAYTFTAAKFKVGEAEHKLTDTVLGDAVSGFGNNWDIPNKWTWERQKRSTKDEIMQSLRMILGVIFTALFMWWLYGVLRSGAVRWRAALIAGALLSLASIPDMFNSWPTFYSSYGTTTPLATFVTNRILGYIGSLIGQFAGWAFVIAIALSCFHILCTRLSLSSIFKLALGQGEHNRGKAQSDLWIDSLLSTYAVFAVLGVIATISQYMQGHFSPTVAVEQLSSVCGAANVLSPVLTTVSGSIGMGVASIVAAAIIAGLYAKYCYKGFPVYLAVMLFFCLIGFSEFTYWQDYADRVIVSVLDCAILWFWMVKLARQNLLSYFLLGYCAYLWGWEISIYKHGLPLFAADFLVVCFLLLLPVFFILFLKFKARFESVEPGENTN